KVTHELPETRARQINTSFDGWTIRSKHHFLLHHFFGLTTSTEQCARLETAEETLPSNKRSMPLAPFAPRKIQSAPHVWASSRISSAGLPRLIKTSACNPALRILCAAGSKISRT